MGKSLIITEKPSVAREYGAILGVKGGGRGKIENDKYIITWCVGHLLEMVYPDAYDAKYAKWKMEDLPFLPKEYKYRVISNVREQYECVADLLARADVDKIYYAGDSGREGQVIMELIRRHTNVNPKAEELRVWIDSFTEEEIKRGIREARHMDSYGPLGKAGILRGIEDYAMGINFTRALTVKYGRMLNTMADTKKYTPITIGRVMTCVLAMIVRREREIRDFEEKTFFRVIGASNALELEWKLGEKSAYAGSPYLYKENGFTKRGLAEQLVARLQGHDGKVASCKKTKEKKNPPLLFNLAELQSYCSKTFKISPEETLKVAQELYEKKLTTYPRTDARVLSTAVIGEIDKNLKGLMGISAVRPFIEEIYRLGTIKKLGKSQYVNDGKITDHYAIIPTGNIKAMGSLSPLSKSIYKAIVGRFLAIFYPPALYKKIALRVDVATGNVENRDRYLEEFNASQKVIEDKGYLKVYEFFGLSKESKAASKESKESEGKEGSGGKDNNAGVTNCREDALRLFESLRKGSRLDFTGFTIKEGKTVPPKRYSTGNLILAMENAGKLIEDEELRGQIKGAGIGTSATRADIIEKLVRIGYLRLNKKTQILTPSYFGEMVYEVADLVMPKMLNPEMTASWEKGLSMIEDEKITVDEYRKKLEDYIRKYVERTRRTSFTKTLKDRIYALREVYGI